MGYTGANTIVESIKNYMLGLESNNIEVTIMEEKENFLKINLDIGGRSNNFGILFTFDKPNRDFKTIKGDINEIIKRCRREFKEMDGFIMGGGFNFYFGGDV